MATGNPFPYSDTNKRYHTYDYYVKHTFGEKCVKIPLDGGFTCPNVDGTCGVGGCIYCAHGGGGHGADSTLPLAEQYRAGREKIRLKWGTPPAIAYFQSGTNTYAPLARLKELYEEALSFPHVVGLSVATRADCLPDEVLVYLESLTARTAVTLELGLQTASDETAERINRCHTYREFESAYWRIRRLAPHVRIGVHLILGLPHEGEDTMLESVRRVAALAPDEVKLHLLYVVAGTPLADLYLRGEYTPLSREAYVQLVAKALCLLPPKTVVGRLTGDGEGSELLAPLFSRDKRRILNEIDKTLAARDWWQGINYQE